MPVGTAASSHRHTQSRAPSLSYSSSAHFAHRPQTHQVDPNLVYRARDFQEAEGEQDDEEAALLRRIDAVPVYPLLQAIERDVRLTIDTGLTWQELTGHDLNFAVVRPLARKYSKLKSPAILYALLTTRIHFLREADRELAHQHINHTRADLCELLAIKLLRSFAGDGRDLVTALSAPFWPFAGADEALIERARRNQHSHERDASLESKSTLQLAVYSCAKKLVATPLLQKCVDGIYRGQIVLGNSSPAGHAIIDDSYKRRAVSFYNPAKAPFLDHRRLRVPRVRATLEAVNFLAILITYIFCLNQEGFHGWTAAETFFSIWLLGLAIDEAAQIQEHGYNIYSGSLFNVLDSFFCIIGFIWFGIRVSGLDSPQQTQLAYNVLSLGSILLCPRLASLLVSDNVLLLALRAMVVEFSYFMGLAIVFFVGFLWCFESLSDSDKWSPALISWLMLRFIFGNTISFEEAQEFTPLFGPWLVVIFTVLAQTLLLTILISLLSATFSRVAEHAQEESLYQHAYATLQGVSCEALFSYFPPLNILCILTVLPASFVLSPRWLHKVNVFIIRATHFPILMAIRLCERHEAGAWTTGEALAAERKTTMSTGIGLPFFARWQAKRRQQSDVIESVFKSVADEETGDDDEDDDDNYANQRHHDRRRQQVSTATDDSNAGGVHWSSTTRGDHKDLNRVMTTDTLPDSPGATVRKARAAWARANQDPSQEDQWAGQGASLTRQDTFASLFSNHSRGMRRRRPRSSDGPAARRVATSSPPRRLSTAQEGEEGSRSDGDIAAAEDSRGGEGEEADPGGEDSVDDDTQGVSGADLESVMLRFLERLDDQADKQDRIEALLEKVLSKHELREETEHHGDVATRRRT